MESICKAMDNPVLTPFLPPRPHARRKAALFLSGSGSNADTLLAQCAATAALPYEIALLVTDRPTSSAAKLSAQYQVEMRLFDIFDFYHRHGESGIALLNSRRRELRELWTNELKAALADYQIDFIILAGFIPLCNIAKDYPALNVHPGDLRLEEHGHRLLVGLHYVPVETALLRGLTELRSSVILAQPFTGNGAEMDSGPLLGVSVPMPITLPPEQSIEQLRQIAAQRVFPMPKSGYVDELRQLAFEQVEKLKVAGDHVVFPPVVAAFANGDYSLDKQNQLYYRGRPVKTVEFGPNGFIRPLAN